MNIVDIVFGHIRRRLKTQDARTHAEMLHVIGKSAGSCCIPSACVDWFNWKDFLQELFNVPSSFQITKYDIFSFTGAQPGVLYPKAFSFSTESRGFEILRKGISVLEFFERAR